MVGEDLQTAQIKDVPGLARLTPGVEFDVPDYSAGIETNIAIRGINARDGSTVGLFLDDIPIPSDRISTSGAPSLNVRPQRVGFCVTQGTLLGEGRGRCGALRHRATQPADVRWLHAGAVRAYRERWA
jgi:hypothetical protein